MNQLKLIKNSFHTEIQKYINEGVSENDFQKDFSVGTRKNIKDINFYFQIFLSSKLNDLIWYIPNFMYLYGVNFKRGFAIYEKIRNVVDMNILEGDDIDKITVQLFCALSVAHNMIGYTVSKNADFLVQKLDKNITLKYLCPIDGEIKIIEIETQYLVKIIPTPYASVYSNHRIIGSPQKVELNLEILKNYDGRGILKIRDMEESILGKITFNVKEIGIQKHLLSTMIQIFSDHPTKICAKYICMFCHEIIGAFPELKQQTIKFVNQLHDIRKKYPIELSELVHKIIDIIDDEKIERSFDKYLLKFSEIMLEYSLVLDDVPIHKIKKFSNLIHDFIELPFTFKNKLDDIEILQHRFF